MACNIKMEDLDNVEQTCGICGDMFHSKRVLEDEDQCLSPTELSDMEKYLNSEQDTSGTCNLLQIYSLIFEYPFSLGNQLPDTEMKSWWQERGPFIACGRCTNHSANFYSAFKQLEKVVSSRNSQLSNILQQWSKMVTSNKTSGTQSQLSEKVQEGKNLTDTKKSIECDNDNPSANAHFETDLSFMLEENTTSTKPEPEDNIAPPTRRVSLRKKMQATISPPNKCLKTSILTRVFSSLVEPKSAPTATLQNNANKITPRKRKAKATKNIKKIVDKKSATKDEEKCDFCSKKFVSAENLTAHMQTCHAEANTSVPQTLCALCNEKFSSVTLLVEHISLRHEERMCENVKVEEENILDDSSSKELDVKTEVASSAFKCKYCDKVFRKKQLLRDHFLFHTENEPLYGCSQCNVKFLQSVALKKHLLTHSAKNKYTCGECDKLFLRKDHLKRHKQIHTRDKSQTIKKTCSVSKNKGSHGCPECHKIFPRKEYLRIHMRLHTGEKPFLCSKCPMTFRDPRNLSQHLITHKTDRPFCCSVCGVTFKRAHHLKDHEKSHREIIERPYTCPVPLCGKSFKLRKHLVMHELVHSSHKDHSCHVCGKSFSRKDNLRQHINKVHGKEMAADLLHYVQTQTTHMSEQQTRLKS